MKRAGALKVWRRLRGKTLKQKVEYWKGRTAELNARKAALSRRSGSGE
jgi:hypothetical protein